MPRFPEYHRDEREDHEEKRDAEDPGTLGEHMGTRSLVARDNPRSQPQGPEEVGDAEDGPHKNSYPYPKQNKLHGASLGNFLTNHPFRSNLLNTVP